MDYTKTGDLFFKIASVVSPFIAAAIAGIMAYYFGRKGKKLDILYANKVPALKAIADQLIQLNRHIGGVLAYLQANEYAGNYHPPGGILQLRADLDNVATMNKLFLFSKNRMLLDDFIDQLAVICAAEARFVLDQSEKLESLYLSFYDKVNACLDMLHEELYT